ncbi:MAG: RNA recognition motif domain-containing protein [Mucilaginibacter sp.]
MKIFIANVPHKLEEPELKQMLTQFGQVASVKLLTDKETGKRKGFGFVEMPVREQAQSAIAALHDKEVYGRKLALSEAVEREQQKESNFQRPRREYRGNGNQEEIDGNR